MRQRGVGSVCVCVGAGGDQIVLAIKEMLQVQTLGIPQMPNKYVQKEWMRISQCFLVLFCATISLLYMFLNNTNIKKIMIFNF